MPEPRYDFCLAVFRQWEPEGFVLKSICLVYVPDMPQQDRARQAWLRKKRTFRSIAYQARALFGDRVIYKRTDRSNMGDLHLWALVPILWVTPAHVIKSVQYDRVFPWTECMMYSSSQISGHNLTKFFRRLCADFNKRGGGRYVLERNQKDVLDYLL